MNWSALTKKQQQMVIVTIVLALGQIGLLAHFLGWTKPASARGGSAKKELMELQQKIEDARTVLRQEPSIRSGLALSVTKLEALTVQLEDAIRQYPDQYLWAHRRWRNAT